MATDSFALGGLQWLQLSTAHHWSIEETNGSASVVCSTGDDTIGMQGSMRKVVYCRDGDETLRHHGSHWVKHWLVFPVSQCWLFGGRQQNGAAKEWASRLHHSLSLSLLGAGRIIEWSLPQRQARQFN